jgi:hypothetical protein
VNEFVEECRREWRRLGVPDPVANEMAADLTADLQEAEADGGTPEDVLGNSAFDPRRFAAAWAFARGVTSPPFPDPQRRWSSPWAIAATVLLGLVIVGAGLALTVGSRISAVSFASRRSIAGPGPIRILPGPGPGRLVLPVVGGDIHPLAWLLFLVGVAGLVVLFILCLRPWTGFRRVRRLEGHRSTPWR